MPTERSKVLEQLVAPGAVLNGKYRVERVIGEGGMGLVVEAWHLDFDERIAIKFLMPSLGTNAEAVARFEREARVLFKIKSPHVCRVLDVGRLEGGSPFLVLEFLEGEDLANRLVDRKPSSLEDAVDWVVEACDAVSEAHARGIVHRDIKPENLFLARTADGRLRIKVLDFGLSKIASTGTMTRERALTSTEQAMGTPHYMAPEQWLSARDVGPASDQWSLAVILYELLAGVPPFDGEQLPQVCSAVLHGLTPSLLVRSPSVPAVIDDAIRRALEKRPADRFESLGAFASAIAPHGRSESRAIAARINRMFDQADQLMKSSELARLSHEAIANISASYPGIAPPDLPPPDLPPPDLPPAPAIARTDPVPEQPTTFDSNPKRLGSPWGELSGELQTGPHRRRHQTAQSWQQPLGAEGPSKRELSSRTIGVLAFGVAITVFALLSFVVGPRLVSNTGTSSSATAAQASAMLTSSSAAKPGLDAESARAVAAAASASAPAAALAVTPLGSNSRTPKVAAEPRPVKSPPPIAIPARPLHDPTHAATPLRPHGTIFDNR